MPAVPRRREARVRLGVEARSARSDRLRDEIESWRPALDDVKRISRGERAKRRGVGSRSVPHRLNADEQKAFDSALKKRFCTLRGTGYRRERKGSPLANTWRQHSDANSWPAIMVLQGTDSGSPNSVEIDLSPLRGLLTIDNAKSIVTHCASEHPVTLVSDSTSDGEAEVTEAFIEHNADTTSPTAKSADVGAEHCSSELEGTTESVAHQQIGEREDWNEDEEPPSEVSSNTSSNHDINLDGQPVGANAPSKENDSSVDEDVYASLDFELFTGAIWEISPRALTYECQDRSTAKSFAADLSDRMCQTASSSKTGKKKTKKKV